MWQWYRQTMRNSRVIAMNLIREVFRMRALVVVLALVTICYTFVFALWLHNSTGRADEKIQTFLSYSLSAVSAMLSLLTIFISVVSIARDIKRKEIFTITTKPIDRFSYFLGKVRGVALLNFILLAIIGGTIYGISRGMQYTEASSPEDEVRLEELIFVARRSVKPRLPMEHIQAQVKARVDQDVARQLVENPEYQQNPDLVAKMRKSLTSHYTEEGIAWNTAVPPGKHIVWHFSDIIPVNGGGGNIFIRYKQDVSRNPSSSVIYSQWMFGPKDPVQYGGQPLLTRDVIRTVHEYAIAPEQVSDEGDLYVAFRNPPQRNEGVTIIYPPDTGIEALYVAGGYEANFLRGLGLVYLRLFYIGIFGVAMGAWLTFPVGVLVVLVVFCLGVSSGFILDAMKWESEGLQAWLINKVMFLLPSFALYDPVPLIERGRIVALDLGDSLLLTKDMIVSLAVGFVGYLVFRFRELARVIV